VPPIVFRKGLDLKQEVAGDLAAAYHSTVVDEVQKNGYVRASGRLTVHLAREFGFCYGVDRAVDYAYQTRRRFPDRRVYLTGEIIHNSQVNDRLRAQDIRFLSDPGEDVASLGAGDVVILPAFGVSVGDLARLDRQGCTLVDTTCGSVLNVWKNVRRYAQDGFTSVIHGKVTHEETRATASQATAVPGAHFVVVRDEAQTARLCDFIRDGGDGPELVAEFGEAVSPGFDPVRDLVRVGCANQTTMLMSESLKVGEMLREAMVARYGAADLASHFRAFDTICSATQERQDAVEALLDQHPLNLAIVVGGYNSSNTCNLARICAERVPTYHIAETGCLVSGSEIRHRPIGVPSTQTVPETRTSGWLPEGRVAIGLTAGASTPNSVVGEIIERLETLVRVPGPAVVTEIS
jgi:4-hydroxy-3-methylbut-2-enyl diphosphate reductase